MENVTVDQTVLAESVSGMIKFEMLKEALVKPLPDVMITKEFEVPVQTESKDDEGLEVVDYSATEKVTKEVPSNFAKGIVLKVPAGTENVKVGDTVVFNKRFAIDFDLLKDSQLVKPYDIVAIEKA